MISMERQGPSMFISRTLRQKLKSAGDLIETVRGVGYRMGGQDET